MTPLDVIADQVPHATRDSLTGGFGRPFLLKEK